MLRNKRWIKNSQKSPINITDKLDIKVFRIFIKKEGKLGPLSV